MLLLCIHLYFELLLLCTYLYFEFTFTLQLLKLHFHLYSAFALHSPLIWIYFAFSFTLKLLLLEFALPCNNFYFAFTQTSLLFLQCFHFAFTFTLHLLLLCTYFYDKFTFTLDLLLHCINIFSINVNLALASHLALRCIYTFTLHIHLLLYAYFPGFVVPAASLVGIGYINCEKWVAVLLLVITGFCLGLSWGGWGVNHMDIAPPFAGRW